MIIAIDGSNSISGGAVVYLINLLKYAEPEKCGIKKVLLYGYKKLLENIEDRQWLEKIYEPELDNGISSRLKWLWVKFPKLVRKSNLVFFAAANYTKIDPPFVSLCHNILPFANLGEIYRFSHLSLINKYRRVLQTRCFGNSKGVIFLSNYAKNIVLKKLKKTPKHIEVIPHGMPERFFNYPKRQKDISKYTNENPFRFLYISAIASYKYQWNVIKAFYILFKKRFPVHVDFIGPVYENSAYKILMRTLKEYDPIGHFAKYIGTIPYNKIHGIYKNYDACIFASVYETFGVPLLEAMGSGLPIASSDFELTREILDDNAVYFDSKKPESIAEAVVKLIEDKKLREKIAWSNFEKAKKYTWNKCADRTFKFFKLVYDKLAI